MGAGGLLALEARAGAKRDRGSRCAPALASVVGTATPFGGGADSVDRLETLDRLRREGTLTEAEFETLKAKIVERGRADGDRGELRSTRSR